MFTILHDISLPVHTDMPVYPGDPPISLEPQLTLAADGVNVTAIRHASTHFGTHVDVPRHVLAGGASLDETPLERFCGQARVIHIRDRRAITAEELAGCVIAPGDRVLFHTRNSEERLLERPAFVNDYVYLTAEGAELLVRRRVGLVGVDYLSVDPPDDPALPAHHILLEAGVLILEGAALTGVAPGTYQLICLPLRIRGGDGAPARAALARM